MVRFYGPTRSPSTIKLSTYPLHWRAAQYTANIVLANDSSVYRRGRYALWPYQVSYNVALLTTHTHLVPDPKPSIGHFPRTTTELGTSLSFLPFVSLIARLCSSCIVIPIPSLTNIQWLRLPVVRLLSHSKFDIP